MSKKVETKKNQGIPKVMIITAIVCILIIIAIFYVNRNKTAKDLGISEDIFTSMQLNLERNEITPEDISKTTVLDCENISDLTGIQQFSNLQSLSLIQTNIDKNEKIDLTEVNNLENLKDFSVYSETADFKEIIASLAGNENIEQLYLGGDSLTDITGISNIPNIKVLYLVHCSSLANIDDLANMKNLEEVTINGNFADLEALKGNTSIKKLFISSTSTESFNLDAIESLNNLEVLGIAGMNMIDVSAITKLNKLKELKIICTPIAELPILDKINTLYIQDCDNITSLKNIVSFNSLKELSIVSSEGLTRNCFNDIQKITTLENLSIRGCLNINTDNEEITLDNIGRSQ